MRLAESSPILRRPRPAAGSPHIESDTAEGTRSLLPASSADSSPGSLPVEEQRTALAVGPTPPAPVAPSAPAAPYRSHNGPAEHCRPQHRRSGTICDLLRAERYWIASAKSLRPEENPGPDESPCLPP